jgi:hypothetical protein
VNDELLVHCGAITVMIGISSDNSIREKDLVNNSRLALYEMWFEEK